MTDKELIQKALKIAEAIIDGCVNVQEDKKIHKDAKQLAKFVQKDSEILLGKLRQALQRPVKSYTNGEPQYATEDMSTKSQNVYTSEERVQETDKSIHDLRKAAEMALQSLCSASPIGHALEDYEYHNKAIEALRQALEQAEYDKLTVKFGERAKEYLEEAKKSWEQEPVAWKDKTYGNLHHQNFGNSIPLYTAPPSKPEQGPVAWEKSYDIVCALLRQAHDVLACASSWPPKREIDMSTKQENVYTSAERVYASDISDTADKTEISDKADEQAEKQDAESFFKFMANNKEVLLLDEQGFHYKGDVVHDAGIAYRLFVEWMKESKQAEKQEPVAYLCESAVGHKYFRWKKTTSHYKPIPLYTAPPKREWVGLTDDELEEYSKWFGGKNVVKAIEDKLKEKNDTINS